MRRNLSAENHIAPDDLMACMSLLCKIDAQYKKWTPEYIDLQSVKNYISDWGITAEETVIGDLVKFTHITEQ